MAETKLADVTQVTENQKTEPQQAENTQTEAPKPEKKSNKERLKDITDSIENGIKELFDSDKYKQYLQTMSRFHRYSVNNQMLINMQNPNATLVAGFNKWHDQFGRNVKKGEKGIKIIAPTPFKKKVEEAKLDPDTKLPMLDENGKPIMEEKEVQIPMFRVVSVFDVSQTYGKPIPQLANALTGDVQNYDAFMEAIKRSCDVPISFEQLADNMDGYFSLDEQKIVIREGMSEVQTVSALLHEMAHSKLHNRQQLLEDKLQEVEIFGNAALFSNGRIDEAKLPTGLYCYNLRGSDDDPGKISTIGYKVGVNHAGSIITAEPIDLGENNYLPVNDGLNFLGGEKTVKEFLNEQKPDREKINRNTEEVQAESVSFAVCAYYGIKTDENSFGYIASWSKDKELPELKASLETINKTSSTIIDDIDKNYAEIRKERGLDNEVIDLDEAMFENGVSYLHIQRTDNNAWDYSLYSKESKTLIDGGQIDNPDMKLEQVKEHIVSMYSLKLPYGEPLPDIDKNRILDDISEKALSQMSVELPDPNITIADMKAYGYDYDTMLPLTKDVAQKLFEMDATVYMLHYDNTEAMVVDAAEIKNFDGIFGIEKPDWEAVKGNYLKNAEMSMEDDYDMIDGIVNNGDNRAEVDSPPTVADLERDVNEGKPISILELAEAVERESKEQKKPKPEKAADEKPSLLAKLNRPLPPQQDKTQQKSKEREM